jgi:hypothetical protein
MLYSVTNSASIHLKTHFGTAGISGSKFNPDIFPNVDSLLNALSTMVPIRIVKQSNNREAHEYYFPELAFTGFYGVGLRKDYPNAEVLTEIRNGFIVSYIELQTFPKTQYVTVVAELKDGDYRLVTVFPGKYAPAFPYSAMSEEEKQEAEAFWKDYILLKEK